MINQKKSTWVALRKESVDSNTSLRSINSMTHVALRKESVDRNCQVRIVARGLFQSLSARRAWIEISPPIELYRERGGRSPQGERG